METFVAGKKYQHALLTTFAPLAFLSGVTGAFFKELSLTMAASLIVSFLIAWIALPIIATRLLSVKDAKLDDSGRLTRAIQSLYQWLMTDS